MTEITQSKTREIIDDFAKEIRERMISSGVTPPKLVINFRNEKITNVQRKVVQVPINLLRYRKENGRIASDVDDYEIKNHPLSDKSETDQKTLEKFLKEKDPENTGILRKDIQHSGQDQPAIITCDGFIINGNRRKMVMEDLIKKYPQKQSYKYMKVVILPGKGEKGGPPTLLEIEQLENRYQLQSDGRSEYYGFDRAISIRRKIKRGSSLEAQVKDDPQHAGKSEKEIKKAINDIKKGYLNPLKRVDQYLEKFNRKEQYRTISTGANDREGRWHAFVEYSKMRDKLENPKNRLAYNIEDHEVGYLEDAAFNIIRLRHIPGMSKVHEIMRDLHKYCAAETGKKEVLNISNKVVPLKAEEEYENGDPKKPLDRKKVDEKWLDKNKKTIILHLKKADMYLKDRQEKETPIQILDAALKKLNHDNMDLSNVRSVDCKTARKLTVQIQKRAHYLEKELYEQEKRLKKLLKKSK